MEKHMRDNAIQDGSASVAQSIAVIDVEKRKKAARVPSVTTSTIVFSSCEKEWASGLAENQYICTDAG
eukprot:1251502-Lingulodinium_polyedra.AAC.1